MTSRPLSKKVGENHNLNEASRALDLIYELVCPGRRFDESVGVVLISKVARSG